MNIFKHIIGIALILASFCTYAQQPQATNGQPLYAVNAKYTNGVAPGYMPLAGPLSTPASGALTITLGGGTANCGSIVQYPGYPTSPALTLAANTTNYIYLDTTNSCIPTVSQSVFTGSQIPIAKVVTNGSGIATNGITDVRTIFNWIHGSSTPGGANGSIQYNNAGAFGGLTPDNTLYEDAPGILENHPTLNASQGGAVTMGDSNSAGLGLVYTQLGPYILGSWAQYVCFDLNVPESACSTTPYGQIATNVAGDRSGDWANRAFSGFAPSDQANPVVVAQYNTNNLDAETNVTPPLSHQYSFVSQSRAAMVHIATPMQDKYLPIAQAVTQSGQAISLGANQAVVTIANNYVPHQRLLVSGCTTLTGLNTVGWVELTAATSTTITFPYFNLNATQSISSDTCAFTPTNVWALGSGWSPYQVLGTPSTLPGATQGIFYQTGNILTFSCSTQNVTFVPTVYSAGATGMTATITVSGGVVQTVTLNASGNFQLVNGTYLQIGSGNAIVQTVNSPGTYVTTGLTLISGGTGYTATSSAVINASGQIELPFTITQFGAGCTSSTTPVSVSCSNGTASSCGQFAQASFSANPQLEVTSSASTTMTLSGIYVGAGGDIEVIYPAGPGFGGSWQITADGGSPLTDTVFGTSTISESYAGNDGYRYGPANFGGTTSLQAAHFKVTPSATHTFVITATNSGGSNVAIAELAVPTATHNAGVNPPNVVAGGALPNQNSGAPTCGLTTPALAGCQVVYSDWLSTLVNQLNGEGMVVKYYDNQNIDPVSGYFNSSPNNSLQNNIVTNANNGLHMSSSGHSQVAGNALAAANAAPATSQFVQAHQGIEYAHNSASNGYWIGSYYGNQFSGAPTFGNYETQGLVNVYPQTWGDWFCQLANPNTTSLIPPVGNYAITPDCGFGFEENQDFQSGGSSSGVLHSLSLPLVSSQTATSHPIELSGTYGNLGVYVVSYTQGTGYTGTPVFTWVSDGSCSTYPVVEAYLRSSSVSITLLTQGVCATGVPSYTLTGISGGSGFTFVVARAGAVSISSQMPGAYTGSGSVTLTGGQCSVTPTLTTSLSGGGIVASINNAGNCWIAPTGFTVSGYTGSGFTITTALPTGGDTSSRWQMLVNGNNLTLMERNALTGVALPQFQVLDLSGGGFKVNLGNTQGIQVGYAYTLDASLLTANITGVPMTTLTTTGSGAATYTAGTGILNIPNNGTGLSGMTATQVAIAGSASTVTSSKAIQGTDTNILSSGTISGTGASLCTDANGGATTSGCTSGSGTVTGSGTTGNLTEWTSSSAVGNAPITDSGTALTVTENTTFSGSGASNIAIGADGSAAGTINLSNGSASAHSILGSAATTTNTILFPATVIANGDLVTCTTSGTTCTLTDGGAPSTGTVSSVGLTLPSWLTVTGSPITGSGTLAVTGTSETANFFLAAPNGSAGAMTPRLIVTADLPTGIPIANIGSSGLSGASPIAISSSGAISISGVAGEVPNGTSGTFTATPTLGASGTLGSLTFGNATSGTLTLQTVTGALGTVTASLPANTGTIAELNLAQTFSANQIVNSAFGVEESSVIANAALSIGTVAWGSSPTNAYAIYALAPTGATNNYLINLFNSGGSTSEFNVTSAGAGTFNGNVTASNVVASSGTGTFLNVSLTGIMTSKTIDQHAANNFGGTCSMSSSTSCTITLGTTYTTPVCVATVQSTTVIAAGCTVSGTTVTITAASSNSATWGAFVFGDPT